MKQPHVNLTLSERDLFVLERALNERKQSLIFMFTYLKDPSHVLRLQQEEVDISLLLNRVRQHMELQ